jgi:hypothetical protein
VISIGQYIHFTEEQKLRAGAVDLEYFLLGRGEKLIASGREKRLASDHSITIRGNEWYDHAAEKGGGPVSFLQTHYGLSYQDAMKMLLGGDASQIKTISEEKKRAPPKTFVLPEANSNMRRVYAYLLKERKLDREVIAHFAREGLIYEDTEHHNCVFVGKDENGVPRHAHLRSTNSFGNTFRINVAGGDPRYSFHHLGSDGYFFVFEAPIDLLSYISMNLQRWEEHSYVACCGTSFQPVQKMLERIGGAEMAYLCLDNDNAGRTATQRMAYTLLEQGVQCAELLPRLKDWNDDLKEQTQQRGTAECQMVFAP